MSDCSKNSGKDKFIYHAIQVCLNVLWLNLPFAELLKWGSDDRLACDDAVPANAHIGEIAPDDHPRKHNYLSTQHDMLRPAQHTAATDAITSSLNTRQ